MRIVPGRACLSVIHGYFEQSIGKDWCSDKLNKINVGDMLPPDLIYLLDEEEVLNNSGNNEKVNEILGIKREKFVTKREEERKMNEVQMKTLDKWIEKWMERRT